jgi:hypothetical protein
MNTQTMLLKVRDCVKETPGLTSGELQERHTGIDGALWKRMREAEVAGYITRGVKRTSEVSGKKCWTWFPMEQSA